jgi:hypothetical protein
MTKAEEIYHRFVNYEWNEIGEGMKVSIIKAIDEALKEGQKLPIHDVIGSVSAHIYYDLSLKAMQLMVDKEDLTVEEFRELPEVKKLWSAMDVIKQHYL